jgi:hypothetical protein
MTKNDRSVLPLEKNLNKDKLTIFWQLYESPVGTENGFDIKTDLL